MKLFYDKNMVGDDLQMALSLLSAEYPLFAEPVQGAVRAQKAVRVQFHLLEQPGALKVTVKEGTAQVHYHALAQACRGLGALLGMEGDAEGVVEEQAGFETMGLMLDCSRNAVMTVPHVKRWLRRMALSGYNMVMLYTEDTYQLPDEPMFGYLRGAYTLDEIKAIDDYAAALGIEVIPCIQTLGHLEQILKWRAAYWSVRDTDRVVLVGQPQTYELIAKMVQFWSGAVRSRRIHIGMDETHDLGRGRYMDLFGYKRGFDIFNQHLARVVKICTDEGLEPMIWSDMYFRMGSETGGYYDVESKIPDDVAAAIPQDAELVYWDYYHTDEAFYREWIKRHRAMGFEPFMASGVWSWGRFVYSHVYTSQTALPCIHACLKEGLKEMVFTMWKDDGAAVDFDSAFAGVLYVAEAAYRQGEVDDDLWAARFAGLCKADLHANLALCRIDASERYGDEVNTRMLLWEDPVLALYSRSLLARETTRDFEPATYYAQLADDLAEWQEKDSGQAGDLAFAHQLAHTLALKTQMREQLFAAYQEGDRDMLGKLADTIIPELVVAIKLLWEHHRGVWMRQNKAFGYEVQCVRYGGLLLRLDEIAMRIREYLDGEMAQIEELEEPFEELRAWFGRYRSVATSSSIL